MAVRETIAVSQSHRVNNCVRLRPIALPVEHGGWSLLFEPIALGLLLAPSLAGVFLSVAAVGLFLARHPYKLAVNDWRKNRRGQRAILAERFAMLYLFVALVASSFAIRLGGLSCLWPLALAAPIAITQLVLDSVGRSRSLAAELAGSVAVGSLASAIVICGGWPPGAAFPLWIIMAGRSVPTIIYLRARLKLVRGKPASRSWPLLPNVMALLATVTLCAYGLAPWLAAFAMTVLAWRAIGGLWSSATETSAQRLGVTEVCLGLITVIAVALGFTFEL